MRQTLLTYRLNTFFAKPARVAGLAVCVFLILTLLFGTSYSQWKQLPMHDPDFGQGTCIYFRPDDPKIGFICDEGYNYKTTDGGYTWDSLTIAAAINDFAFKDSYKGWASAGVLLTTADGGNTWEWVKSFPDGPSDVYYDKKYNEILVAGAGSGVWESWDEGVTWAQFLPYSLAQGLSFWNDDTGIVEAALEFYLTTDGGRTWNLAGPTAGGFLHQVLAIPGTTTAFAIDQYGVIRRTDDLWHTWHNVYQFPPEYNYYGNGGSGGFDQLVSNMCITGDLQNLYVTLDSGCFRSTDQGQTWKYLCGVWSPLRGGELNIDRFYAKGNRVFVSSGDTNGTHFWMLNVDSMQYFPTTGGLAFPDGTKRATVQPGTPVTINYSPQTSDPIGIDTGHLVFHYDSNALSLQALKLTPSWIIHDSSTSGGTLDLRIIDTSGSPLPTPAVQLFFTTYLSTLSTKVYLDSADLSGHRLNCDCQALSIIGPDSVEIDFTGCGDSTIVAAMEDEPPFTIESIVPNPARASLRVQGTGYGVQGMEVQMFDALGKRVFDQRPGAETAPLQMGGPDSHTLHPIPYTLTLDVSDLPSGIYFLRLSAGGYAVSRSVAIER